MKHIKRRLWTLFLACLLMLGGTLLTAAAPLADTKWQILCQTNNNRIANGQVPLSAPYELCDLADIRAWELTQLFDHTRPDGSSCFTILNGSNIVAYWAGENIAAGYPDATSVMNGWMASDGHRGNILDSDFSHMGIGYTEAPFSYYGKYYVQFFTGGCQVHNIALFNGGNTVEIPYQTSVDDAGVALNITCDCGQSVMPLYSVFCSGYSADLPYQLQPVTVNYRGASTTLYIRNRYWDVLPGTWFHDSIYHMVDQGLFVGVSETEFAPDQNMTRAQLVTALFNMSGDTADGSESTFVDVNPDGWYKDYIAWGQKNGIISGVDPTHFEPDTPVSREDAATIFQRYAQYIDQKDTNLTADLSGYTDYDDIDDYALSAMNYCVASGIMTGNEDNTLAPLSSMTRAELVSVIERYIKLP